MRAAALALLLAGCGGGGATTWSSSATLPTKEARILVSAWSGTIRLRNSASGKVEFTVRGEAPLPLAQIVTVEASPRFGIAISEKAADSDLEIEVAAPPGSSLSCGAANALVHAEGEWGDLGIKTAAGSIDVAVRRVDSGKFENLGGPVRYVAAEGPSGAVRAMCMRGGDVTVRLPASWNGQLQAKTATGSIDVPPHEGRLVTLWAEDRKGVVGHVGPAAKAGATLPTVWGEASSGNVSMRLEE